MKRYCLIVLFSFLMLHNASGKLRNGYEKHINYVHESLMNFYNILNTHKNLSPSERRKIRARIEDFITYQSYYELTENLLAQFRIISPGIFNKIDSIKDARGRAIDVYVQFIPRQEGLVMPAGTTYMAQSNEDEDACLSEYGKQTASVKIWAFNKALLVLSHELGHVEYQVPNLAAYTEYYKKVYPLFRTESSYVGHECNDSSGHNAAIFEKEFKKDYLNYLKLRNSDRQLDSPLVLIQEIRRKVQLKISSQLATGDAINNVYY